MLLNGHTHVDAQRAELLIALVLIAGIVLSVVRPAQMRATALVTQGFALALTLVGTIMIAMGLLMMSGQMTRFAFWLLQSFPAFGSIG